MKMNKKEALKIFDGAMNEQEALKEVAKEVLINEHYGLADLKAKVAEVREEVKIEIEKHKQGLTTTKDTKELQALAKVKKLNTGLKTVKQIANNDMEIEEEAIKIVKSIIK